MKQCIKEYHKNKIHSNNPFGWKLGLTTFTMPVVFDSFSNTKVLHIIRDGRDVMLSRLDARIGNFDDLINRVMVFGDKNIAEYKGEKISKSTIEKYRNELEMMHWVTSVKYRMKGRKYKEIF